MSYPENYKYTKSHEWLDLDGDTAKIGITDYAQSLLGDIVFVELPDLGAEFEAAQTFGTVESVKAVSDLYMPIAGRVIEVNEALNDAPETINSHANTTWIIKLAYQDAPVDGLLNAAEYEKFVAEETGH